MLCAPISEPIETRTCKRGLLSPFFVVIRCPPSASHWTLPMISLQEEKCRSLSKNLVTYWHQTDVDHDPIASQIAHITNKITASMFGWDHCNLLRVKMWSGNHCVEINTHAERKTTIVSEGMTSANTVKPSARIIQYGWLDISKGDIRWSCGRNILAKWAASPKTVPAREVRIPRRAVICNATWKQKHGNFASRSVPWPWWDKYLATHYRKQADSCQIVRS